MTIICPGGGDFGKWIEADEVSLGLRMSIEGNGEKLISHLKELFQEIEMEYTNVWLCPCIHWIVSRFSDRERLWW